MSSKQVALLEEDHFTVVRRYEGPSPYVQQIEDYYVANPAGFRGKIMLATWIPETVRRHMVQHVAARLARPRRRARRVAFRQFIADPAMKKVVTRRLTYSKRADGEVLKRDKATGRFVAYTRQERAQLQQVRKHGK